MITYNEVAILWLIICISSNIAMIPSIKRYNKEKRIKSQTWPLISYTVYLSTFGLFCRITSVVSGGATLVYTLLWQFG